MRRWRQFFALGADERRVFLWSLALLPVTSLLLRGRGLAPALAFLGRMREPAGPDFSPVAAARLVNAAARLVGASCLTRSIVLWRLARAHGAVVRLGVARSAQQGFSAHAWVELAGRPLNDTPDVAERYAALEGTIQGRGA